MFRTRYLLAILMPLPVFCLALANGPDDSDTRHIASDSGERIVDPASIRLLHFSPYTHTFFTQQADETDEAFADRIHTDHLRWGSKQGVMPLSPLEELRARRQAFLRNGPTTQAARDRGYLFGLRIEFSKELARASLEVAKAELDVKYNPESLVAKTILAGARQRQSFWTMRVKLIKSRLGESGDGNVPTPFPGGKVL